MSATAVLGPQGYAPLPLNAGPAAQAQAVRDQLGLAPGALIDVLSLVENRGWNLRRADLLDGGRGLQAGLTPDARHGFTIVVDQQLLTSEAWELAFVGHASASEARVRFRVAHEVGHTFFFRPPAYGDPHPSRSTAPDQTEEAFCDDFAQHLLIGGDPAAGTTSDPAELVAFAYRAVAPIGVALSRLGLPAIAGVVEPRVDRPALVSIMFAHGLDDSWVLWRRRPELKTRLIAEQRRAGTAVGFIAVCSPEGPTALAVTPWTPEAEAARRGYRLHHDGDQQHTMGPAA